MASKSESPWLDPAVARYVAARCSPPDEVLGDLITQTTAATGDRAGMQIAPDQGALLSLLVRLVDARSAVEVGTFTGYSSVCIARALGPDGHLLCCDVSEHWTAIARAAWERAGLTDRIELRLAPALDTLRGLPADASIDFGFIDADKGRYRDYYEELLLRLRPGGLLCVDNTLWSGRVVEGSDSGRDGGDDRDDDRGGIDADTLALREFNDHVAADERVESYIVPIADGLTIVRKR